MSRKHTFIIHNSWALGDTVCLSALVRDIHKAYPGKYELRMAGHYRNVFWRNNPHCKTQGDGEAGQLVKMDYQAGIVAAGRGVKKHFLSHFHHMFAGATGLKVPVTVPKGDIHLSVEERDKTFVKGRYWVVVAGGKRDMTAKIWYAHRYQEVVDALAGQGIACVQAGAQFNRHYHPKLQGCVSTIGQTDNERDFFALIAKADGVICGVTAAMHIAAVFDKPCVVVAGGREEPWWEAYTNAYAPDSFGPQCSPVAVEHTFLHTIGLLDCGVDNLKKGCWRSRTVPLDADDLVNPKNQRKLCRRPLRDGPQAMPECMAMITTAHVVEAVMRYYENGTLPPIGAPTGKYTLPLVQTPVATPQVWLPKEQSVRKNEDPGLALLDHPFIGGKLTAFVLAYGEHAELAKRCIGSILQHAPEGRIDLRVALNQPGKATLDYVRAFPSSSISKVYLDRGERRKYPAMREMFWDDSHPITTKYVLWFDDDSWVFDPKWLIKLAKTIVENHPEGCRMYGARYVHDLTTARKDGKAIDWFRQAPWWKNEWLHLDSGRRRAPNGSQIVFASGGFWALATETLRAGDIPDRRLVHNGGDITIGAQVTQAGARMLSFTPDKKIVKWSDAPRRGFREPFPWQR